MVYTSDIAIDDISFSKNLTCVSSGRNTRPEIFEGIIFCSEEEGKGAWVVINSVPKVIR